VETEYSLISSSVELHATRHKLLLTQRQLGAWAKPVFKPAPPG
jgi:hypothetical protein